MKKKNLLGSIYFYLVIALAEYLLNIFFKYYSNDISITQFNFYFTGNFIVTVLTLVLISGILLNHFTVKSYSGKMPKTFKTIAYFMILPYLFVFTVTLWKFNLFNQYLWGYPLIKILIAVSLSVSKIASIYLIALFWLPVLYNNGLMRLRSLIVTGLIIVMLLIFSFTYSLIRNTNTPLNTGGNLGFVFGAAVWSKDKASPIFKGRIDEAYQLYTRGYIKGIQLTGGNAPGELSEAQTAKNHLVKMGVDPLDIVYEEQTSNTAEQIKFIHKQMTYYNENYSGIILISDKFHLSRIMEICNFFGINAQTSSSEYKLSWEKLLYYRFRESIALLIFWIFGL